MCLVDQVPCESVLTPAISCTKFKIHLAHADSLWPKHFFFVFDFREDKSLLHRPRNSVRECTLWTNSLVGYLRQLSLAQSSNIFSACRQSHGQNIFYLISGRTSLFFTDQETQEENMLSGPTPLWVSSYTSYLLCKVQDPFSACRQPHSENIVFFLFDFREDRSLLHRPRHSGRECA